MFNDVLANHYSFEKKKNNFLLKFNVLIKILKLIMSY